MRTDCSLGKSKKKIASKTPWSFLILLLAMAMNINCMSATSKEGFV